MKLVDYRKKWSRKTECFLSSYFTPCYPFINAIVSTSSEQAKNLAVTTKKQLLNERGGKGSVEKLGAFLSSVRQLRAIA